MAKAEATASGGVGVFGLLGVAFVVLRLCHQIDWAWKWVLAPFWMPLAALAVVLVLFLAVISGVKALK